MTLDCFKLVVNRPRGPNSYCSREHRHSVIEWLFWDHGGKVAKFSINSMLSSSLMVWANSHFSSLTFLFFVSMGKEKNSTGMYNFWHIQTVDMDLVHEMKWATTFKDALFLLSGNSFFWMLSFYHLLVIHIQLTVEAMEGKVRETAKQGAKVWWHFPLSFMNCWLSISERPNIPESYQV